MRPRHKHAAAQSLSRQSFEVPDERAGLRSVADDARRAGPVFAPQGLVQPQRELPRGSPLRRRLQNTASTPILNSRLGGSVMLLLPPSRSPPPLSPASSGSTILLRDHVHKFLPLA